MSKLNSLLNLTPHFDGTGTLIPDMSKEFLITYFTKPLAQKE